VLYILHGNDEFSCSEAVSRLKARSGDPNVADLNTVVLDGTKISIEEITHHCDSIPFLAEHRLVIVEGLLSRFGPRSRHKSKKDSKTLPAADKQLLEDLLEYLPHLPDFTDLVFVDFRQLEPTNPILDFARRYKKRSKVERFDLPRGEQLIRWIMDRGERKGVKVDREAAQELSRYVGNNLRLLDQELEKLAMYVGHGGMITGQDVTALVSLSREARIFDLVDALGQRQPGRAVNLLHRLLNEGNSPLYLLSMITRQFRLISIYRELAAARCPRPEIRKVLGVRDFVLDKLSGQAPKFTPPRLRWIHHRLLDVDQEIKTGRMEATLALELLVVDLTKQSKG